MARDFVAASTEYFEISNTIQPSLPISLLIWINPDTATNTDILCGGHSASGNQNSYKMRISGAGKPVLQYGDNTSSGASARRSSEGTNTFSASSWNCFVGWMNGATDHKILLNGTNQTLSYTGTGGTIAYTGNGTVGQTNSALYVDGRLSHFAIWNVKLTDGQLSALSRGANPFGLGYDSEILGYFPIGGNDSPESNYVGQSPKGTLTGTTKHASNPPVELIENYL